MTPQANPTNTRGARYLAAIRAVELTPRTGRVIGYQGLVVESSGPDVYLGEICEICSPLSGHPIRAEVIGFRGQSVLLMPYGELQGIRSGSEVLATGKAAQIGVGEALLGRVTDAFGRPLDGRGPIHCSASARLVSDPPNPVQRARISQVFETGVKCIDTCLTVGVGQRIGIFSGSGVGKSTLLGMIARHSGADVNVIALIGERGREVRDFLEEHLGDGLRRSIVIVATADQPALVRIHAALAATAIAEFFRDKGLSVALLLDSLTRLAMAQREVGLAVGEPPTARGYTPSVFSFMPRLLERAGIGTSGGGSITGFVTVLVEGDDLDEPVSDHARAILDGHIVLSRRLAQLGQFPAVDLLQSTSRLTRQLADEQEQQLITECVSLLALYENSRDMIDFGAYKEGANARLDKAVRVAPRLLDRFKQGIAESVPRAEALKDLAAVCG